MREAIMRAHVRSRRRYRGLPSPGTFPRIYKVPIRLAATRTLGRTGSELRVICHKKDELPVTSVTKSRCDHVCDSLRVKCRGRMRNGRLTASPLLEV